MLTWNGLQTDDGRYVICTITGVPSGTTWYYLERHAAARELRHCDTVADCKAQAQAIEDGTIDEFEERRAVEHRRLRARRAAAEAASAKTRAEDLLLVEGADHADDLDDWVETLPADQQVFVRQCRELAATKETP